MCRMPGGGSTWWEVVDVRQRVWDPVTRRGRRTRGPAVRGPASAWGAPCGSAPDVTRGIGVLAGRRPDLPPRDLDPAALGPPVPQDLQQRRRLAAAGLAHQAQRLAPRSSKLTSLTACTYGYGAAPRGADVSLTRMRCPRHVLAGSATRLRCCAAAAMLLKQDDHRSGSRTRCMSHAGACREARPPAGRPVPVRRRFRSRPRRCRGPGWGPLPRRPGPSSMPRCRAS